MTGRRRPAQALRFIAALPAESATAAMMRATPSERGVKASPPPWRVEYGWGTHAHLIADLWDLTASKGTPRGKKAPAHPRASRAQRQRKRRPRRPTSAS